MYMWTRCLSYTRVSSEQLTVNIRRAPSTIAEGLICTAREAAEATTAVTAVCACTTASLARAASWWDMKMSTDEQTHFQINIYIYRERERERKKEKKRIVKHLSSIFNTIYNTFSPFSIRKAHEKSKTFGKKKYQLPLEQLCQQCVRGPLWWKRTHAKRE